MKNKWKFKLFIYGILYKYHKCLYQSFYDQYITCKFYHNAWLKKYKDINNE